MQATSLSIPDVYLIEPKVFEDRRGYFFESFNARRFAELTGCSPIFVQDNQSRSMKGTLRGLHFQTRHPQGKLVRVTSGAVFDVAVDLRPQSPTYKHWLGETLTAENHRQLWIPEGCAHGFLVLSEVAECQYKVTDYWDPQGEGSIRFDDPEIAIEWPKLDCDYILSEKDLQAPHLSELA